MPDAIRREYGLEMGDYARIFRRKFLIIALTTFASGTIAWVYTRVALVPRYMSNLSIEVTKPVLDQRADAWLYYQGSPLQTAIEQIRSRLTIRSALVALGEISDSEPRAVVDRAVDEVLGSIAAAQRPQTNIIEISITGTDPPRMIRRLEGIASTYVSSEAEWERKADDAAITFINERIEIVKRRLADARARRIAYEIEHPGVSVGGQASGAIAERASAEIEIERLLTQIASLERQREGFAVDPERLEAADPVYAAHLTQKRKIEADLVELREKYTESHPAIGRAEEEILSLEASIAARLPFAARKAVEGIDREIAHRREDELRIRMRLAQIRERLATLPADQIGMADLSTEESVLESRYNELLQTRETRELTRAMKTGNVMVLGEASPPGKVYPNDRANFILGLTLGFVVGLALAILLESLDTSIRTIEEIEDYVGLPVFGVVPTATFPTRFASTLGLPGEDDILGVIHHHPRDRMSEAYRQISTALDFRFFSEGERSLLICSATPQEGKTTTISNLGMAFAKSGKNVCIVDGNMRHPSMSVGYALQEHLGLSEVLRGEAPWKAAVYPTAVDLLDLVPAGKMPSEPVELLKKAFPALLRELSMVYDVILIDAPPILPVADASVISALSGGSMLVYSQGRAPREALQRAKTRLSSAKGRLVGVLLNNVKPEGDLGKDYYYAYYQYYSGAAKQG